MKTRDDSQALVANDEKYLTTQVEEYETTDDFKNYWYIFNKYKWKIFGLTLLIGLLSAFISLSLKPIYRSTAQMLIESEQKSIASIEDIYGINPFLKEYYQSQLEILKSRTLAEKVVNKLNLVNHPLFNQKSQGFDWRKMLPSSWLPQPDKEIVTVEEKHKNIVKAVMGQLSIMPVRNSQLINISFESSDAVLAAKVPNTLIKVYIESDLDAKLAMTNKAASWLNKRIEGLRKNLRQSEQKMQNYMERNNLINVTGIKSIATRQIEETVTNLVRANLRLTEAESRYKQIRKLRGRSTDAFESIPTILENQLVQTLKTTELDAEKNLSTLSHRYGRKHPKVIAAKTELKTAKSNTAMQIKRVIGGIIKEYEIAIANVKALTTSLKENELKIQQLNRKQYQLGILEREVKANRQLYDVFLSRFKETDVSQDIQRLKTVGRIIDLALVSAIAYKPNKKRLVIISLVLGFMFSTMFAFFLEYLDNTIKNREDVERKLGMPLLTTIPKLKLSKRNLLKKTQWMFLSDSKSEFAESIRTARTGIMLSALDSPQKILMVTSSVAAEGKTTFAINQAFALGQMEKTLLIDADMRKPRIAKAFGLNHNSPGLSELVAARLELDECIYSVEEEKEEQGRIEVIPSGVIPPNPLELLASKQFKELLEILAEKYTYIVIDSPPCLQVSDALVLAKLATEVLYVVKADVTPSQLVLDGIKRFYQMEIPVHSIVLNNVDFKKQAKYGPYYKYGYGY
jgi:capsular exopolysaccharide synthesis family protein